MISVRTLILPDIHLQWEKAEKIIKHESCDNVVFLGDYFDEYDDNVNENYLAAKWLLSSLNQPNRIHLFGNHDFSYVFPHRSYKCSGYTLGKDYAINDVLKEKDWRKLKTHTWVDNFLLSHAGVHPFFYQKYGNEKLFKTWIDEICKEALDDAFLNKPEHLFFRAGKSRGGIEMYGGIIWCDRSEFEAVENVNQIFGHTPGETPIWLTHKSKNSRNLALDNYGHCNYYAVHTSDREVPIEIKHVKDL